jgi:CheY-like chemotaxis protein
MKPFSILVVDDEDSIRRVLVRVLEPMGVRVVCAGNGIEALRAIEKEDIDMVITDVLMPEMDGIELIPLIKKRRPKTYVLAMSGGGHNFMGEYCTKLATTLGADAVIMKPFMLAEVQEAVGKVLPVKPMEG